MILRTFKCIDGNFLFNLNLPWQQSVVSLHHRQNNIMLYKREKDIIFFRFYCLGIATLRLSITCTHLVTTATNGASVPYESIENKIALRSRTMENRISPISLRFYAFWSIVLPVNGFGRYILWRRDDIMPVVTTSSRPPLNFRLFPVQEWKWGLLVYCIFVTSFLFRYKVPTLYWKKKKENEKWIS